MSETQAQKLKRLEQENQELKELQSAKAPSDDLSKYMSDINFLNKSKIDNSGANKIVVQDISDHKNISLWTKWGKRVGPLHPNNAEYTYRKFYNQAQGQGMSWKKLLVKQPTEQEVSVWLESEEGKSWSEMIKLDRKRKDKTKKKSEADKIVKAMAQQWGVKTEEVNSIRKPQEVGK